MFWLRKGRLKKALRANALTHDAIVMGIADKYIKNDNIGSDDFELQLLGRALNWAVPSSGYNFRDDLVKVENGEFKQRLMKQENKIFKKGLSILNSDLLVEQLVSHYVAYEIYLIDSLYTKDSERMYPGVKRMKKILFQTTVKEPNIGSPDFKENYKNLFVRFNSAYGKYGKTLNKETIDWLFSFI